MSDKRKFLEDLKQAREAREAKKNSFHRIETTIAALLLVSLLAIGWFCLTHGGKVPMPPLW